MKYSLAAAWLTLTLSAPFTAAVADEIYRWVDADGVVNYTQRKPAGGTNVEQVETLTGSTNVVEPDVLAPQAESDDATAAPELTDAQRQMLDDLEQAERERQQEVVKIRAENCEKARDVLEKLTQRSRIPRRVRGRFGTHHPRGGAPGADRRRAGGDRHQLRLTPYASTSTCAGSWRMPTTTRSPSIT